MWDLIKFTNYNNSDLRSYCDSIHCSSAGVCYINLYRDYVLTNPDELYLYCAAAMTKASFELAVYLTEVVYVNWRQKKTSLIHYMFLISSSFVSSHLCMVNIYRDLWSTRISPVKNCSAQESPWTQTDFKANSCDKFAVETHCFFTVMVIILNLMTLADS